MQTIPSRYEGNALHTYHAAYNDDLNGRLIPGLELRSERQPAGESSIDMPEMTYRKHDILKIHRAEHDAWFDRITWVDPESQNPPLSGKQVYQMDPFAAIQHRYHTIADLRDDISTLSLEEFESKKLGKPPTPAMRRRFSLLALQIEAGIVRTKLLRRFHPEATHEHYYKFTIDVIRSLRLRYKPADPATDALSLDEHNDRFMLKHEQFRVADRSYRENVKKQIEKRHWPTFDRVLDTTAEAVSMYALRLNSASYDIEQPVMYSYAKTGITKMSMSAEFALIAENRLMTALKLDPEHQALRDLFTPGNAAYDARQIAVAKQRDAFLAAIQSEYEQARSVYRPAMKMHAIEKLTKKLDELVADIDLDIPTKRIYSDQGLLAKRAMQLEARKDAFEQRSRLKTLLAAHSETEIDGETAQHVFQAVKAYHDGLDNWAEQLLVDAPYRVVRFREAVKQLEKTADKRIQSEIEVFNDGMDNGPLPNPTDDTIDAILDYDENSSAYRKVRGRYKVRAHGLYINGYMRTVEKLPNVAQRVIGKEIMVASLTQINQEYIEWEDACKAEQAREELEEAHF